jgi:hypothetical protein
VAEALIRSCRVSVVSFRQGQSSYRLGVAQVATLMVIAVALGWVIGAWLGYNGPGTPPVESRAGPSLALPKTSPGDEAPTMSASQVSVAPTSTSPPTPIPILEMSGTGNALSDSFFASTGWQIQWQTEGGQFILAVTGDPLVGVLVDQPGPASGVRSVPSQGRFNVEVTAKGPWRITVLQPGG